MMVATPPELLFVQVAVATVGQTEGTRSRHPWYGTNGAVTHAVVFVHDGANRGRRVEDVCRELGGGLGIRACAAHLSCHRRDRSRGGIVVGEATITWRWREAILGFGLGGQRAAHLGRSSDLVGREAES